MMGCAPSYMLEAKYSAIGIDQHVTVSPPPNHGTIAAFK